ncbi:hypothetical protein HA402_001979 [Bradysia odoriphaga]|nr:hypothetical protein HA402_001979 [Bradysia odoriphaga]
MLGAVNNGFNEESSYSSKATFEIAEVEVNETDKKSESKLAQTFKKMKLFIARHPVFLSRIKVLFINVIAVGFLAWATYHFIDSKNRHEASTDVRQSNETEEERICGVEYCGIQWCDGYGMLLIVYGFIYAGVFYYLIKRLFGKQIMQSFVPMRKLIDKVFSVRLTKMALIGVALAAFAVFLVFDTIDSRRRLQSLIGIGTLLSVGFVFSANPTKIRWRPVISGFTCQVLLGLLCIRWEVGRDIFKCFGDKTAKFLNFSLVGSTFVYGEFLSEKEGVFAFAVLSVIFFVSFVISILYYLGAMQWFVMKLGWLLQKLIGTTVCESLTCAANIFLGMSESPLLIKPYIKYLTRSEIHVIMSSGFATVSGSVLAAYISYGAEPAHLVISSVMAAPAALCFAKLFYPETEESKTDADNIQLEKSTDSSILDAASNGAQAAIPLILGICANIVAFVSFVALLNAIVGWLFILIGYDGITFEWIFSKLFIPLAWIIGIEWDDCESVARLIATKTIINEFVAYELLGKMKAAQEISLRSSAIATFAICGFANPSSLGIMIGTLSAMCPEKRPDITSVAFRAFISGSVICFITASIAGLLMTSENYEVHRSNNGSMHLM